MIKSYLLYQPKIIPTIVADMRDAKLPAISALIPYLDKNSRLLGASEPIPPICIPMLAKFAKPHSI